MMGYAGLTAVGSVIEPQLFCEEPQDSPSLEIAMSLQLNSAALSIFALKAENTLGCSGSELGQKVVVINICLKHYRIGTLLQGC